jgi:hypothetical protein
VIRCVCGCLLVVLVAATAYGAVSTIEDVKEIDSRGEAELDGQAVTVTGVVTVGSGTFSSQTSTLDAYIQDKTGGINVYTRSPLTGIRLRMGDSVVVTGTVQMSFTSPTKGVIRLKVGSLEDLEVVGKGTVPEPVALTVSEATQTSTPPFEPYEGVLVRIEDVSITAGDWPTSHGVSRDLTVEDATGSLTLRIDGDTDIGGTAQPADPFIVVGVVVQNDATSPYLSGYTVWPRSRYDDFLAVGNGSGIAVIDPSSVDNDLESFDLTITLSGNGRDTVTAFSVDLPLADGWTWPGGAGNVELTGPGMSGATYEAASAGVTVRSCAIWDAGDSYGSVILRNVSPPAGLVSSAVIIKTSVDGTTFEDVSLQPVLRAVYPIPEVYISEVFPEDGMTSESDAFIELHNIGATTAHLEGYVLCEQRVVPYCDFVVRHVFAPGDTLGRDGYLVLVESLAGFNQRFDYDGAIQASISPLGREGGDGGLCGGEESYEVISLWRDASLSDVVHHVEYKDAVTCPIDMCEEFEPAAFGIIPPVGYSLVSDAEQIPENPPLALTATPTPGEATEIAYKAPVLDRVQSHVTDVMEVFFSEPMDDQGLGEPANFTVFLAPSGTQPADTFPVMVAAPSISGEKVLLLFDGTRGGLASLNVTGQASQFGEVMRDTVVTLVIMSTAATRMCRIQDSDEYGFSPLRDSTVFTMGFITVPPGVFQPEYSSIYVQGLDGCGVNAFSYDVPSPVPVLGDFVTVSGDVTEYVGTAGSTTEIYMSPDPRVTILSTWDVR